MIPILFVVVACATIDFAFVERGGSVVGSGELHCGAVVGFGPGVGSMLGRESVVCWKRVRDFSM